MLLELTTTLFRGPVTLLASSAQFLCVFNEEKMSRNENVDCLVRKMRRANFFFVQKIHEDQHATHSTQQAPAA